MEWRLNNMKTLFTLISMCFVLNTFAQQQDDVDKVVQQFLEQRKKMMEEIMKAFDEDDFFKEGDAAFDDKMFDQIRKQGFRGFQGFNSTGNNVKIKEKVEANGDISVLITPKSKNIKLDIQTSDNQIVIKSERMSDVENKNKQGVSRSYSKSSYSQTIRIPNGFTAKAPVKKDDSIVITLSPKAKSKFKPDSKGRVPVQKGYGDETI